MRYVTPGQHRTVQAFREHLQAIDPDLGCDDVLLGRAGPLGQPLRLGDVVVGNRWATQPMEGWDGTPDGLPSEHTVRRWRNFGRSGAKLIWGGEAFAVQEDGRANPNQLYANPKADVVGALVGLRTALEDGHREAGEGLDDLYVGLQLTHSGRFARPRGEPRPRVAYRHPVLDARFGVAPDQAPLTDVELEGIGERFVATASLARQAGFRFVDVKCCHGYLLHELLGAKRRPGPYGGSLENRTRLLRRIVAGIRAACPDLEVAVRVSIADVYPHVADGETGEGAARGWREHLPYEHGFGVDAGDPRRFDLREPLALLGMLRDLGIRLVNLTLASPYYAPHLQRPAAYPPSDGYEPPEDPLGGVAAHLRTVRACKAAFPDLALVGSGYSYLQEYLPHVAQHEVRAGHVDVVGLGRMLLAYPELPADVLAGRPLQRKRICRTFSDCTTGPRNGMISGCFPLDPHYKQMPEAARIKEIKKALRR